ncbi:MAG: ECF transporter S component [Defluviitaleaceae bacterium]|nr:ECF transporter S component [Defluviitaleaceae bacterium]
MFTDQKLDIKKMAVLGMLSAVALVLVMLVRIPIVLFLYYEPKDVAITIGGFLFGPLAALLMAVVVSFVEMVTISADGFYGLIMNIIASSTTACTAAFIYKRKRSLFGAVVGLAAGIAVNVPVMLLWNYLVVPIYLGVPREIVAGMLVPYFLPFNLVKGILNAAIIMLVYKPLATTLKKAGLFPKSSVETGNAPKKRNIGVIIVSLFAILTTALYVVTFLRSDNNDNGGNNQGYYEQSVEAGGYYDE